MNYYPIFLDLRGKPCLVVGGGEIGTRKVEGLLKACARVTVISPTVTDTIQRHADAGDLRYLKRQYRRGDLKGYFLAYAATGAAEVDIMIACEASIRDVLLNVVDRPVLCGFITPATVQRGDLAIAVSTGGKCPAFAKRMRQKLETLIGEEYGALLKSLEAEREALMHDRSFDDLEWRRRIEEILESDWQKLDQIAR